MACSVILASEKPAEQQEGRGKAVGRARWWVCPMLAERGGHVTPLLPASNRRSGPGRLPDKQTWILSVNSYFPGTPKISHKKGVTLLGDHLD